MAKIKNELVAMSSAYQRKRTSRMQKLLARSLPRPFLRRVKRLFLLPLDGLDLALGRRQDLVPPRRLNFAGDGDFVASGSEFLSYFVELGGLKPEDRVLEVGSGIGRMARPLTAYLGDGSYEGIDIVGQGIRWCQANITKRHPNFRFQLADVRNTMYNPEGKFAAAEYRFPFDDGCFDFVYLTSVFTHMLRREVARYLGEIARTLRPNGRCFATYFLLNEESRMLMESGCSSLCFDYRLDNCWTDDAHVPEHAIAFDVDYIRSLHCDLGFTIETIQNGGWCGRNQYLSYQDILVARRG